MLVNSHLTILEFIFSFFFIDYYYYFLNKFTYKTKSPGDIKILYRFMCVVLEFFKLEGYQIKAELYISYVNGPKTREEKKRKLPKIISSVVK